MKRKVGLVLAYRNTNYGAQLQAFATQHIVDNMGFETEIIDYKPEKWKRCIKFDWGLFPYFVTLVEARLKRRSPQADITDEIFLKNKTDRETESTSFIDRRLHDIKCYVGYSRLCEAGATCDAVIIGSDQRWHPGASFGNQLSLRFVPREVRRVSYATSLGVSSYPKYCWHSARLMWKSIDYLSVREYQGARIVEEVCKGEKKAEVVVDPTYLLTKEQWQEIIPIQSMMQEPYVFCYFLGNDIKSKECARRYADVHGFKLVSILSDESYSELDQAFADHIVTGASPELFVNWIRGATIVFTDSFHGLAFSVINNKQFYVFYRKRDDVKESRNSRIDNILQLWKVQDRLVLDKDINWRDSEYNEIDYKVTDELVKKEREKSLFFLKKALTFDEDN